MNVDWKRIDETPAPLNADVLVYNDRVHGYAVAKRMGDLYHNSISGQPFQPAPTHWTELPPPPTGVSGYRSYSAQVN